MMHDPGSPRHAVLPAGGAAAAAEFVQAALPECSLTDVVLCGNRHTLTLFNHFTIEVAKGNEHTMELLAGALALDLRLHAAAAAEVLCPLLEQRLGPEGARLAGGMCGRLQAVEADALEVLTLRRERNWPGLAERVNHLHQGFAGHVREVELAVLPRLAAAMQLAELVAAGLRYQQALSTASLAPAISALPAVAPATGTPPAELAGGKAAPALAPAQQMLLGEEL